MGIALESCGTDTVVPVRRALCAGLFPTASRLLGTAVAGHGDPGTAEYQMVRLAGPGARQNSTETLVFGSELTRVTGGVMLNLPGSAVLSRAGDRHHVRLYLVVSSVNPTRPDESMVPHRPGDDMR